MPDIERITVIIQKLKLVYPHAGTQLHYSTPWDLLVAVILSAQCTDVMVNKVTEKLFAKYRTLDDYIQTDISEFEKNIRSTGFYHNKAKNILASAKLIRDKFGGRVPQTMAELLTLPGVARKTANVVLGNAFSIVEGIAVDTHVLRLSQRLRLVDLANIGGKKLMIDYKKDADPVKIERELMAIIPKKDWFVLTYLLIDHGRAVCKAQNPNCAGCSISQYCPSSRV